jgi:hypothetical protein
MADREDDIIPLLLSHIEGLFPRTCSCGRTFATLREYVRSTQPVGDVISYDAASGDWAPARPVGTLALANCPCGTTMAISTEEMPLDERHRVLAWIKAEMTRRGVASDAVVGGLRERIRKRAVRAD